MKSINIIYYSPTQTTKTIVNEIARHIELEPTSETNLAKEPVGLLHTVSADSLTIIGLPVYGGRLPQQIIKNLKQLKGNQSPVVIVVVYGNRDYDDALLELNNIVHDGGFKVLAAAAFIGEHSYSTKAQPIAQHRPDSDDLQKCKDFADLISQKLEVEGGCVEPAIQGNYPYKPYKQMPATIYPTTVPERCTKCGICVGVCLTNAITMSETLETNGAQCTVCCACTRYCPEQARVLDNAMIDEIRDRLYTNCSERKEPEYFI
ncbi:EFR1 family ferrodoxin [Carboxylicivirga sp. A043]|uniref:EFR1 family ferrodoxin n=1 Tax=Carboxylicivirga litoralis TaxID=2816963 RepID=UPI0021CB2CB6|nr:EFR1 family ferrodoxin [Carboxylicivirga sp. A043]MCU4154615.1 EFR1 family ferrodoxin [Carboxylicivirga sp. A043]